MNRIFYAAAGVAVCGFVFLVAARFGVINVAESIRYVAAGVTIVSGILSWAIHKCLSI